MCSGEFSTNEYKFPWLCFIKILEAQMKADLAEKESLEAKRAQQEEESRENSKLISEQKAVRSKAFLFILFQSQRLNIHTVSSVCTLFYYIL